MSGICGIVNFDGAPVDQELLKTMAQTIAHRGPDGIHYWQQNQVGLAHLAFHTTPEAQREDQPLVSPANDLTLVADARVDNREELIHALSAKNYLQQKDPTDTDLILAAYACWEQDCTKYLVGDFAFAIWDARRQHLFCARDPMGVRSFYYHYQPHQSFAFATEIKALLALPWIPKRLNEAHIPIIFESMHTWDKASSFYQEIFRLPPGHQLLLRAQEITKNQYWSLDPQKDILLSSDQEYADAFRELFREAVQCRLRTVNSSVGSFLSGGLDSSSIVCTAQQLLSQTQQAQLHTFSFIFDDVPQSDERQYIQHVLNGRNIQAHFIYGDQISPLTNIDQMIWLADEPVFAPNLFLYWAACQSFLATDIKVILNGFGGDSTVSHGVFYLAELVKSGRWFSAISQGLKIAKDSDRPYWRPLWSRGIRPYLSSGMVKVWRALRNRPAPGYQSLFNPEFRQRLNYQPSEMALPKTARQAHYDELNNGFLPLVIEILDKIFLWHRVEPRFPFFDQRLMQFCLALPGSQKLKHGLTRFVLRQAMRNTLPPQIAQRTSKGNLSFNFNQQFLSKDQTRLQEIFSDQINILAPYLDLAQLNDLYHSVTQKNDLSSTATLFIAVNLAIWLETEALAHINSPNVDL